MTSCTNGPSGTRCHACTAWDVAMERERGLRRRAHKALRALADDIGDIADDRTLDMDDVVAITDTLYALAREMRRP